MRKYLLLLTLALCTTYTQAQTTTAAPGNDLQTQKLQKYKAQIDSLTRLRDSLALTLPEKTALDAYSLGLITPNTLYINSVLQQFSVQSDSASADDRLARTAAVNNALARLYVSHPELITQTQRELEKVGGFNQAELGREYTSDKRLTEQVVEVSLDGDIDDLTVQTRKPNFWKLTGNGSLQFTQSYFSDKWYQGGENSYSALAMLTLSAIYDNKQRTVWENKLEVQLGLQTSESDTHHKLKPTSNVVRLTTKLGYKAVSTLYYTAQLEANTQLMPTYDANSENLRSEFLGPLYANLSLGIDYKWKTQKFSGNLYIAPIAYNLRYVRNEGLASRYGIAHGENMLHDPGSRINVNWNLQMWKNVSWQNRMIFFTNYSYMLMEWENTFNFTINKYMSAKFQVYPRFDDSSPNYRGDMGFFMLKEWLSLGLNYNW